MITFSRRRDANNIRPFLYGLQTSESDVVRLIITEWVGLISLQIHCIYGRLYTLLLGWKPAQETNQRALHQMGELFVAYTFYC